MNLKNELTKYIAAKAGLDTDPTNLMHLRFLWWANPRNKEQGGLRLTLEGFEMMQIADIKLHKIKYQEMIKISSINRSILDLDHLINCPFYITNKAIYVTDDRIAVQLILFSGDVNKFIYAKKRSAEKCLTVS